MNVIVSWTMAGLQVYQNVRIRGADGGGAAVGEIDAAVRNANVVNYAFHFAGGDLFANGIFDQVTDSRGLLDASASAGADVQFELAAVNRGEKVFADPGNQNEGNRAGGGESHQEQLAMVQNPHQPVVITVAEALKRNFKSRLPTHQRIRALRFEVSGFGLMSANLIFRHGWNQSAGEQVGGEHGE